MRRRASAAVLVAAMAVAGVGTTALAGTDPADTVRELLGTLVRGRFEEVGQWACAARRDDAERRLDLTELLRDVPSESRQAFVGALVVSVSGLDASTIEEHADRAVVRVTTQIGVSLDEAALRRGLRGLTWTEGILDASIRRSVLEQRIRDRLASVPSPVTLDGEVELVREAGGWRVCGDLGWGIEALDPQDVCGLLSPAELGILAALPFHQRAAEGTGCTYSAAPDSGDLWTVNIRLDTGDLDLVRTAFPDGSSFTVDAFDAYAASDSLWVDIGGRLLAIQATLVDTPDGVDGDRLARSVAEVVVPRIRR